MRSWKSARPTSPRSRAGRERARRGVGAPGLPPCPAPRPVDTIVSARVWVQGARPRTLGAAVVPVLVGTAAAERASAPRTLGALVVALGMQVGVNYANDYFDGVRGVDTAARAGPVRLTASGLAAPRSVALAAGLSLLTAAFAGLLLAIAVGPELIALGVVSLLAAVLYSGGPRPYASYGMGELFVFVFFGLVATCGTAYVQVERVPGAAWWSAVPVGLLAVAILLANNVRDIPTDAASGKRTLAVRIGDEPARALYRGVIAGAFVVLVAGVVLGGLPRAALLALLSSPLAVRPLHAVARARGPALVPVLLATVLLHLAFGALLATGLWLA